MKEAKERGSGAVKKGWEPRNIEARYLGQHALTGAMIGITADGIVCVDYLMQTGWQDLKGVPWDLRPTGMPVPEVDVEAQPGAAEADRRERRLQRPRERAEPVRPRVEAPRGGLQEERAAAPAPASASDAAETEPPAKRTRGERHSSERVLCCQEGCGQVRPDSKMPRMRGCIDGNFSKARSQRRVSQSNREVVDG